MGAETTLPSSMCHSRLGLDRGNIGIMENKMETTITYWGYVGIIPWILLQVRAFIQPSGKLPQHGDKGPPSLDFISSKPLPMLASRVQGFWNLTEATERHRKYFKPLLS